MNIHIAYDHDDKPIGVLLADSEEKAHIAWAGMKTQVNRVEVIDPNDVHGGVHGVVFLLTADKVEIPHPHRSYAKRSVYLFKRGL